MKNTATQGNMKFTVTSGATSISWSVTSGEYEIFVSETPDSCGAVLYCGRRALVSADGRGPQNALHFLALAAKRTVWTEEEFFAETFMPMGRALAKWVKRPVRETYNSR